MYCRLNVYYARLFKFYFLAYVRTPEFISIKRYSLFRYSYYLYFSQCTVAAYALIESPPS